MLKLQYGGLEKIDFDVMLLWCACSVASVKSFCRSFTGTVCRADNEAFFQ